MEDNGDFFVGAGVDHEAGVVGGDREGAAAAIHEDGQLDLGGAAVVKKFIESGFHGATGLEHIVDENDGGTGDIDGDEGGSEFLGDGLSPDVVAVEGDIDDAGAGTFALRVVFAEEELKAGGDVDAAVGDAEQDEVLAGLGGVSGGDGGGELVERAGELSGGNTGGGGHGALGCAEGETEGKA